MSSALIRLGSGDWSLWPHLVVRSAGFPADGVLRLADEGLAASADEGLAAAADEPDGDFERLWQKWIPVQSERIATFTRSELFRLAVTWQNPRFVGTGIEPLLRRIDQGGTRTSKQRTREQVLAGYWQRYCLKNESIGFFGPVTWATVGRDIETARVVPGPRLVDRAVVHLERWPVEVLARKIARENFLDPWLYPRRDPTLQVLADRIVLLDGSSEPVSPLARAILMRADGMVSARELARLLAAESPQITEEDVSDEMCALWARRRLLWKLELPVSQYTENELRAVIDLADEDVRSRVLPQIERLAGARDRIQLAWHDPAALRSRLADLAETFTDLTGHEDTRHQGETYGGRTLTYLECRRGVSIELGTAFVDRLAPLTLVLDSVRWLTWHIRQALEPEIRAAYRRLLERGIDRPNVAMLWVECIPLLGRRLDGIVATAIEEFHRRWRSVLGYEASQTHRVYRTGDLRAAVAERFAAPRSGWTEARLCSPDVMIAAAGPQQLQSGVFSLVLGEVHVAMNSSDGLWAVAHHTDPAALLDCIRQTFPRRRLLTALPAETRPRFTTRSHPALVRPEDYRLTVLPHVPPPSLGTPRPAGDALVEEHDGTPTVVIDGTARFEAIDLFAEALKRSLIERFRLFPGEDRPRITVDQMVIGRQSWSADAADLGFARVGSEPQRFAEARRWARERGMPRQVFVKSPAEVKPFFVDFASPVFVEALAAAVRRLGPDRNGAGADVRLTVTEMLPTPGQAWLPDAEGELYTAECRLTMSDNRRWQE